MSSDDNQPKSAACNYSADTSPPDTRAPTRHSERTAHDDDQESTLTSGTVRRNRPPAISTGSRTDYGSRGLFPASPRMVANASA